MNERLRPVSLGFLMLSLLCQAGASVLGKIAALRMGSPGIISFLSNPWYLCGLACLVLQAYFWQIVLREVRLFVAYLVTSLNYFLILAASYVFFMERVTLFNLLGATVIGAGVYLTVREDFS